MVFQLIIGSRSSKLPWLSVFKIFQDIDQAALDMAGHLLLGGFGVLLPDGVEEGNVLLGGLDVMLPLRGGDADAGAVPQAGQELIQPLVVRCRPDRRMDRKIQRFVFLGGDAVHPRLQRFQLLQEIIRLCHSPLGGPPGGLGFQQNAHLIVIGDVFFIKGLDDRALVHSQLDHALGLQGLKGLAHRGTADPQPLGNLGQAQLIAALVW